MTAPTISWQFLTQALAHFEAQGYAYVEAPWTVRRDITEITFPNAYEAMGAGENDLVGSAEQSLIQLMFDNQLKAGKYVALTPCFRQEDKITETHRPYFMKVELFDSVTPDAASLENMVQQCLSFFKTLCPAEDQLEVLQTPEGFDIMLNGIEVGSYGVKTHNTHTWLCGTGLAEPRFSVALNT